MGTKAKITQRKQELELLMRTTAIRAADVVAVWNRVVADALDGSQGAQKLVLEYSMSKVSDLIEKDKEEGPKEYVFYVVDSRPPGEKTVAPIEGEFTPIALEDDRNGSAK
jgi:hypothetical protein